MSNSIITSLRAYIPRKGSFLAHTLTLMTGTSLAQGLLIIAAPILTRLYSPQDFGVYAIFLSASNILSVAASMRYEMAIMLPADDEDAANLLFLSMIITVGMSLLVLIGAALFRTQLAILLKVPELAPLLWWVPANLLFMGLYQILNFWTNRKKHFQNNAISRVTQSTMTVGSQISAGILTRSGCTGLISGQILGNASSIMVLGWKSWRELKHFFKKDISINKMKEQGLKYKKFPQFSVINGLFNTASLMLPSMLFSPLFGTVVLGQFFLAQRVFSTPLSFLGSAFSQVFFQKASEYKIKSQDLRGLILKSYKTLFLIAIMPMIFLMIFAPILFETIFGKEWRIAGEYCRLILPWLILMFIISPSTVIFSILDKQELAMGYETLLFFFRLTAILIGALVLNNAYYTIMLYGLIGFGFNMFVGYKIISLTGRVNESQ